jgi:hypothetical protein
MPAKAQWLLRLPEIIGALEEMEGPLLGRSAIEKLFTVRPRRAQQLMRHWSGYQIGTSFQVQRLGLLDLLRKQIAGADYQAEAARRKRVEDELSRMANVLRGHSIQIRPTGPDAQSVEGLPASIRLAPGKLEIEFFGTEDLLTQLRQLALAIVGDYDRFEQICESEPK